MQISKIIMHASGAETRNSLAAVQPAKDMLLVRNSFTTIQGEGMYAGRRAHFIRLGGCNLGAKDRAGCRGCDTDFDVKKSEWRGHTDLLLECSAALVPLVVITGGEPTLQPDIVPLAAALKLRGFKVQVETNGTQPSVVRSLLEVGADVVVSPKASKYGYVSSYSWDLTERAHFKFVMSADPANQHHHLPEWAVELVPKNRLWLSPCTVYLRSYEGEVSSAWDPTLVDHVATRANYEYAASKAMELRCNVSIQMHTWLGLA